MLTDQCTPPKSSSRRDAVNFEWRRLFFVCEKSYKVDKRFIMIALIEDKSEYSQCGAKLLIYVKNENINTQKIFLSIHDLAAAEG